MKDVHRKCFFGPKCFRENFEKRTPGLKTGMDNARNFGLGDTPPVDNENYHYHYRCNDEAFNKKHAL